MTGLINSPVPLCYFWFGYIFSDLDVNFQENQLHDFKFR